jgi:hypothetical protein
MTLLQRRLVKLEGCFPPFIEIDRTKERQVLALATLPMAELELLRGMLIRHDPPIAKNEAEEEAIRHCNEAMAATAAELKLPPTAPSKRRN